MRKTSLFVFIFSVLFFSCSQDSAQIASAESSVIFDYSQNPPDMRLSVFVNSESDVRLASKIKIVNKNSGLEWNCDELVKFEDKNKNSWTGCANIVAAFGMKIPAGEYVLTYFDMAGDEDEILFIYNVDDDSWIASISSVVYILNPPNSSISSIIGSS